MASLIGSSSPVNNIISVLADPEGRPLGSQLDLPQNAGPRELQTLINTLLHNEESLPYAFYIKDEELIGHLGAHLLEKKVSVEQVLQIVYQPQAVFKIRPVSRCSATIAGHSEAVLAVAFSPDSSCLASGSGDTTVRFWDLNTQTPLFTCTGHKSWVLCISWSPDGRQLVSGSKDGVIQIWDPVGGKAIGNPLIVS